MELTEACRGWAGIGCALLLPAGELERPGEASHCRWQDQKKQEEAGA